MPARMTPGQLPARYRAQVQAKTGQSSGSGNTQATGSKHAARPKPSRTEDGKPTVGRCIPHTGTCTWTGPYGAAFERHTRQTGHHRLELIDTEDHD